MLQWMSSNIWVKGNVHLKQWSHLVMSDSLWPHGLSPPSSSVHGTLQARTLEWVAICFSRGYSWPRDQNHIFCVSCIIGRFFTHWAFGEAEAEPIYIAPISTDEGHESMDMCQRKIWEMVKDREAWHAAVHGITESDTTERLNNNISKCQKCLLQFSYG